MANGRKDTSGEAAMGKYWPNAKQVNPTAERDESSATPGILRRMNSPKRHNRSIMIPVIKLLANAIYQASS